MTFRSLAVRRLTKRLPGPAARMVGRLNTRPDMRPEPEPGVRDALREFYEPHVRRLMELLDDPIPEWSTA